MEAQTQTQTQSAGGRRLIKEEVDEEDIAEIVSRWEWAFRCRS